MTANIKARRKLADLYRRGVAVRFGPSGPAIGPFTDPAEKTCPADTIEVFVAVPSPLQREQAVRDARAHSLGIKKAARDGKVASLEGVVIADLLEGMSVQALIEYLIMMGQADVRREAERSVVALEEWADMIALQDLMRRYDEGELEPEGPAYDALMERDREYGEAVHNRVVELTDASREALELLPREELERRVTDQQLELISSEAFVNEYTRQMLFYSVREADDHDQLFFDSVTEYANSSDEVQNAVDEALGRFIGEESEAKNLPGAEDGSQPSTPPSKPETSESSTPAG